MLVVAHGNSIRALRMVLQNIGEDAITELEIPTGIPYRLTLDDELNVLAADYLGDPEAAARGQSPSLDKLADHPRRYRWRLVRSARLLARAHVRCQSSRHALGRHRVGLANMG